jgi:hypothetical protein
MLVVAAVVLVQIQVLYDRPQMAVLFFYQLMAQLY